MTRPAAHHYAGRPESSGQLGGAPQAPSPVAFGSISSAVGLIRSCRGPRRLPGWTADDARTGEDDVARLKIASIGGGSTRAAGTMASFIEQRDNFAGSEFVLITLDADRLDLIRGLAERMARSRG